MLKAPSMVKAPTLKKQCTHYWIIEPARGSTSFGKGKYCGTVTEFVNDYQLALLTLPHKPVDHYSERNY